MTNPNTAPSAAQPYAIDGVVYAIARKDQREAYVMFDTPAQANGFVEYMRRFIEKPVPAQTGGEAVAPEAKPEWPKGAFFTDGEGSFYDEQAEPLPGKESRHMDDSELYCPQCNGSGEGREMTTGHGPDDYEYDCPCQLCGGDGSLLKAFDGMKANRDELRQKYYAALRRAAPQVAASVPSSHVLVPREPTQEMLEAAVMGRDGPAVYKNVSAIGTRSSECEFADAYRAMLASPPQHQVKKGEPS